MTEVHTVSEEEAEKIMSWRKQLSRQNVERTPHEKAVIEINRKNAENSAADYLTWKKGTRNTKFTPILEHKMLTINQLTELAQVCRDECNFILGVLLHDDDAAIYYEYLLSKGDWIDDRIFELKEGRKAPGSE